MKVYIYCYKNKLQGMFSPKPWTSVVPPNEILETVKFDLAHADQVTLQSLKEDELYFIGIHNTETGICESHLEFIVDIGAVASNILCLIANAAKEEDHGKDCEN